MTPRPLENLQAMMPTSSTPGFITNGSGGGGVGVAATINGGSQSDNSPRGGSISLAMLFDFIIQRTYQELTVLAEL